MQVQQIACLQDNLLKLNICVSASECGFQVHGTVWNTLADVDAEVDYLALEESFAAKATVQVWNIAP